MMPIFLIHRYVVKCMKPPMTIPHGMPGTAYQFDQPGPHNELKHIETAKQLLRIRCGWVS